LHTFGLFADLSKLNASCKSKSAKNSLGNNFHPPKIQFCSDAI
jgi:hypothetical protein